MPAVLKRDRANVTLTNQRPILQRPEGRYLKNIYRLISALVAVAYLGLTPAQAAPNYRSLYDDALGPNWAAEGAVLVIVRHDPQIDTINAPNPNHFPAPVIER